MQSTIKYRTQFVLYMTEVCGYINIYRPSEREQNEGNFIRLVDQEIGSIVRYFSIPVISVTILGCTIDVW